ncbi:hypothetical protein ACFQS2_02195 [Brachybacterium sp. GCM10030267]|uniref:hypothetical protein n=1 Tax=Brachybacterium sp. GCM10030267 TaxID=3273381 RepID=UPI00362041CC
MIISGAATVPEPGGRRDQAGPPGMEELRVALRPPELPLPFPRSVLEAAHRVGDLVHAERYRDARALAEEFRTAPAEPGDRLALLRAALRGAVLMGDADAVDRDAADMVSVLHRSGFAEQAQATVAVLLERGPVRSRSAAATKAAVDGAGSAARGRRRGQRAEPPPELLAVVRGLEQTSLPGADEARGAADPRRAVTRLRAALKALPAVREKVLGDPDKELRLRMAQALEAVGDPAGATTHALDVLEVLDQEAAEAGGPLPDPARIATSAHAVLARTLGIEHPLHAARHALDALETLHEVEDPPLRIGLITDLLRALMAAGATAQASFTAGRLASLQRSLQRDALRTGPLLAVAAQRIAAERYEAAWVPLEQARRIADQQRDHRRALEASRLAASIHERTGDHAAALQELRRVASEARWLADDLATPRAERARMIRTELEAHALVLRRALDLGRTAVADEVAGAIERRARPEGGRPLLPPELLWDHRVDARVGRFIAVGTALAREEAARAADTGDAAGAAPVPGAADSARAADAPGAADAAEYERRRREAMQVIDEMPAGHDARARYWAAYVDDRHAEMLADRGIHDRARRAAKRARDGWAHLEMADDVARVDALLERLGDA